MKKLITLLRLYLCISNIWIEEEIIYEISIYEFKEKFDISKENWDSILNWEQTEIGWYLNEDMEEEPVFATIN